MKEIPTYIKNDVQRAMKGGDYHLEDFENLLRQIVDSNSLDDPKENGILKLTIDLGTNELSERQLYVLKTILDRYNHECKNCERELSWDEIDIHEVGDNMCHSCQHDWNKMAD